MADKTLAEKRALRPDLATRAAELYRADALTNDVPGHLVEGLVRYLAQHIRPGGFLSSVLGGNVFEALCRADPASQQGFGAVCLFLFRCAPSNAWGSPEKFEAWLADELERPRPDPDAHLGAVIEASLHGGER